MPEEMFCRVAELKTCLDGISYPVTKHDLVSRVHRNGPNLTSWLSCTCGFKVNPPSFMTSPSWPGRFCWFEFWN
ncbi:hypothetical protein [Dehalococcoides mccartyi]|uniref:hypothetical protein n=1 Tax=Dehalococcoides mccartyi TaxID=61435 RepID=UPI000804C14D|nr:hypothetical protein [Dehalococcoides mccartyi]OBW61067.1 MAG: hypothetical protein A9181_07190 [Dehalococcoides mccartyi]OBW62558.1 MAG: hypothetical protein A9183_07655 [Dehalococcoides mccartyi]